MDNLKMIIELLPKLKSVELDEVGKRIAFLKTSKGGKSSGVEEELFYGTLVAELGKKIKKKQPPFHIFARQAGYKQFKEAFATTIDYISLAFRNERINRAGKQRIYLIATKLVIDDFDTSPVPLSLKTLINGFSLFPSLMDRAFPGYTGAGVLPMLLRAKYGNKKPREENEDCA